MALDPAHGGGDGTIAALSSEATTDTESRRNWRPLAALIPAALLAAVGVWEVAVIARAGHDVPGAADWERASKAVRARHRPGDLIVFAPRWIDPVGRMHLGDLIGLEMAARMDGARYGTIWELSIRDRRAPETAGLAAESSERFGAITVRRYVREPAVVLYDFGERLSEARIGGAVARRPSLELEEVGFEPHRCVRAVPRAGGTIAITYDRARLGSKIVGYVGIADVFTRREVRAPGRLQLVVNNEVVADVTAGVDDGWVRFEATTTAAESAVVEFRLTAVGPKARNRLICYAAEARR